MLDRARVRDFAPGEGVTDRAQQTAYDDGDWLEIAVPGSVHRTLIAAGRIPDAFYDQNETACAWMEEREWWFRLDLDAPGEAPQPDERWRLVFHGLDTFVTVWLDGQELGRHANMFRPVVFDVTEQLTPGKTHQLALCFDPPLAHVAGKTVSNWGRNPERTVMRKAQFGYGWDWGPRLPTIGIWRPVELKRERKAALVAVHFSTVDLAPGHDRAVVAVRVEAERFATSDSLVVRINLAQPSGVNGGSEVVRELVLDGTGDRFDSTAYVTIEHPSLWWTHDLGEPALYSLHVSLRSDGDVLDAIRQEVGIRTIVLDQAPDPEERGTRFFRFVLNGVPIFARGADWIPCDSYIEAILDERYENLLAAARDANMTMLRVWGGGIYEHEVFYETCDRLGLLVWQDFMFACAMYPEDDPSFAAEVDAEARYQIRRLLSHPCLALWCGNNENQWIHDMRYWNDPSPPPYGELFYNGILPAAVAELDGRTPYWPGTPFGGDDHNDQRQGNVHNWNAWHGQVPRRFGEEPQTNRTPEGVSYLRYEEDMGRFCSEFGLHAAPTLETLRRVIPEDQLYHHSPAMDWHNKDDPKNKGDMLMEGTTGLPGDLMEYIDLSQLAQAEGLKFGIEHYRRRKPHCSGALVWQLNDCWPVLSWSVIDYYGFGKAGYFYLKRVFAPVLASFKRLPDGGVELWVTNERLEPFEDTIALRLAMFGGEVVWEEERAIEVPANSSRAIGYWVADDVGGGADRYLAVRSSGDRFPANRHFFVPLKDLKRSPAEPEVQIARVGPHELRVDLRGQSTAYDLLVHVIVPHEATRYSDNYVDLAPGERRTIAVTNPVRPLTPEDVALGWR
jgi:beta-mannosidase